MPRWRALPEELDPQIREFASQLRRLVDRSGMSVATIADRTGYSKSSWERYLNGRLLPPRGATQALAEVTGTDVRHLGTMWELAERAWSRSEMRHDVTMEAIQVAQARAALGEFGDEQDKGRRRRKGRGGSGAGDARAAAEGPVAPPSPSPSPSDQARGPAGPAEAAGQAGAARTGDAAVPYPRTGSPAPAASAPSAASASSASRSPRTEMSGPDDGTRALRRTPAPSPGPDERTTRLRKDPPGAAASAAGAAGTRERATPEQRGRGQGSPVASSSRGQQRVDMAAWGAPAPAVDPGGPGQGQAPGAPGAGAGDLGGPATTVQPPVPPGGPDMPGPATPGAPGGGGRGRRAVKGGAGRRRVTMLLAGIVGALVVVAAAVLFFDLGGGDDSVAPSPSATKKTENLPSGVKCSGEDCSGKDPETMGCGGQYAKTTSSAWVGPSYVEVRHSKVCKASWARITSAVTDDELRIAGPGGQDESDEVGTTNDAYTKMVSVLKADDAKACAILAVGTKGCTTPGKAVR